MCHLTTKIVFAICVKTISYKEHADFFSGITLAQNSVFREIQSTYVHSLLGIERMIAYTMKYKGNKR